MNIIVLCGGLSAERDVSITSGTMVTSALRRRGHKAVLVDLYFGYPQHYDDPKGIFDTVYDDGIAAVAETAPDLEVVKASRKQFNDSRMGDNILEICRAADIVFMALHGEDGEDGKVQATFDMAGIKYTGSGHLSSAVAMNKEVAKKLFEVGGVKTPRGITVKKQDRDYENVGFPCVVKPRSRGSSVGVSVVKTPEEYGAALELAFKYEDDVIVEQYIKGRECDVGVLAGKAFPVIEICPKSGFYDYKNKYQSGLTDEYCPADLPAEVTEKLQRTAERVYEVLMFDVYGRMDFIVDETGEVWCLEGNTLPGLTPTSLLPQEAAADGMSYDDLCEAIIAHSLKKYGV
ncbi:D-alanine-D-alanine ligase [Sporobacter termitidis DSM 10068]|uniref:D-alanine--D-alanine ligase n=1 Tax=Sporobacter termitidis DSM 10068 TaxID=1123282 RepID=A0A1M5ZCP3_9FIRM|nr:D-alanine--D-alanine ligase [Sporobacter termitidis]SHI21980.1 D-alanine-D-alanine ligase [Sporobacter termitidis DSM 10068]